MGNGPRIRRQEAGEKAGEREVGEKAGGNGVAFKGMFFSFIQVRLWAVASGRVLGKSGLRESVVPEQPLPRGLKSPVSSNSTTVGGAAGGAPRAARTGQAGTALRAPGTRTGVGAPERVESGY
jgi:hypothetical protein